MVVHFPDKATGKYEEKGVIVLPNEVL